MLKFTAQSIKNQLGDNWVSCSENSIVYNSGLLSKYQNREDAPIRIIIFEHIPFTSLDKLSNGTRIRRSYKVKDIFQRDEMDGYGSMALFVQQVNDIQLVFKHGDFSLDSDQMDYLFSAPEFSF